MFGTKLKEFWFVFKKERPLSWLSAQANIKCTIKGSHVKKSWPGLPHSVSNAVTEQLETWKSWQMCAMK